VQIARQDFGAENHWGKKIVRTGINTLQPYVSNPPDLVIQDDGIVFFDFHPIFDGWEADLGRTYVLGNDPLKQKIKKDVEAAWHEGNAWYSKQKTYRYRIFLLRYRPGKTLWLRIWKCHCRAHHR
jgi:hypothetical protein